MKNEERVSATRARLVGAAISALAEIGYHRTTFVEVSRRSALSRGAIHHHFESIPDLMAAVTSDINHRIQRGVTEGLRNIPPDADLFDAVVDVVWAQMQEEPYRALNQIRAALATDMALQSGVKDDVIDVAEWLHQQARSVVSRSRTNTEPADPAVIRLIWSSLSGAAAHDVALGSPPEDPDWSAYVTTLKDMIRLFNSERANADVNADPVSS